MHNDAINAPLRAGFEHSISQERNQSNRFNSAINGRNQMGSVNSNLEKPVQNVN